MIAESGHFALVLALLLALLLAIYPLYGAWKGQHRLMAMARPLALGMFTFTAFAYGCLTYSFVVDDFSLAYVANHSNSMLPVQYKMTAVWGGHEGSFLLWVLMMSLWTAAIALFSRGIAAPMLARVLGTMGLVAVGFYLFLLLTSNPFESLLPFYPVDGRDLNPLLQDFGMIIHPPMLYMGYVGFSVAFAFAIAALLSGRLDSTWARWARPWVISAWAFLTCGIALGSWWAYYELGWGGWWFWDPVENASFMPWLVGTALMHSLAVTEKRKVFQSWTLLLAIAAFSLSLLGTFLVRSGILVSVHAFASDPERGLFILAWVGVVIGGSLLLYALRGGMIQGVARYKLFSREVLLAGNNVLLMAATLVVLLGTLLPLVHKELGMGSISVGAPFFNQMFSLLIVPFVLILGVGPLTRWKQQSVQGLRHSVLLALLGSGVLAFLLNQQFSQPRLMALLGLFLSLWIVITSVQQLKERAKAQGVGSLSLSQWGMVLGHLGFAVSIIGITLVSNYNSERDVRVVQGDQVTLGEYRFVFDGVSPLQGVNYSGFVGKVRVFNGEQQVAVLRPEKRFYPVQRTFMTEAAIDSGIGRDLFVALGEELNDNAWSLRVYVKPFVSWIWGGAFIMALGGVCSICDKRYRLAKVVRTKQLLGKEAQA